MKRKDLIKEINRIAKAHGVNADIARQGKHEVWECAGLKIPIPRHNEIAEGTARTILRRLTNHLESR